MPTIYLTEYARQGRDLRGHILRAPEEPPIANQTVAISGSSTQSAVFNARTAFVRVTTDATCAIVAGTSPTATASSKRMAANSTEYIGIPMGQGYRLAVISTT